MKLEDDKQLFYRLIYKLSLVELEILKTYIEIYLKIGFIWAFNSLLNTSILFKKKPNGNLGLYVNYQGLNNLIIKNQYLLLLIEKCLDQLG